MEDVDTIIFADQQHCLPRQRGMRNLRFASGFIDPPRLSLLERLKAACLEREEQVL